MIKNHRFIKQATKSIDCIYGLKYKNPRFLLPNKLILHSHILKQLSGHLKLHQIGTMVYGNHVSLLRKLGKHNLDEGV